MDWYDGSEVSQFLQNINFCQLWFLLPQLFFLPLQSFLCFQFFFPPNFFLLQIFFPLLTFFFHLQIFFSQLFILLPTFFSLPNFKYIRFHLYFTTYYFCFLTCDKTDLEDLWIWENWTVRCCIAFIKAIHDSNISLSMFVKSNTTKKKQDDKNFS